MTAQYTPTHFHAANDAQSLRALVRRRGGKLAIFGSGRPVVVPGDETTAVDLLRTSFAAQPAVVAGVLADLRAEGDDAGFDWLAGVLDRPELEKLRGEVAAVIAGERR